MYRLQYPICKSRRLKKGIKSALLITSTKIKSALIKKMNKSAYKMILIALKEYRHIYITHYMHDEFLFGFITGILQGMYINEKITYYDKEQILKWLMNKMRSYKKESGH